jgi:hypothetical protein
VAIEIESDRFSKNDIQAKCPPEIRWSAHPLLDESPAKSTLLFTIILGLSVAVTLSFESGGYGFLTFGLLTASLSRYFFFTRYALDASGVQISHLSMRRKIPWTQIRRRRIYPDGIFLSPFNRPNRLDSFRGCFLRFAENRDEVIQFVQSHIPHPSP